MTAVRLYLIEKQLKQNGKEILGDDFDFKLDESFRSDIAAVEA